MIDFLMAMLIVISRACSNATLLLHTMTIAQILPVIFKVAHDIDKHSAAKDKILEKKGADFVALYP
jgi:hypothetical protein